MGVLLILCGNISYFRSYCVLSHLNHVLICILHFFLIICVKCSFSRRSMNNEQKIPALL